MTIFKQSSEQLTFFLSEIEFNIAECKKLTSKLKSEKKQAPFHNDIRRNQQVKSLIEKKKAKNDLVLGVDECFCLVSILIENALLLDNQKDHSRNENHIELLEKKIEDMIAAIGEINKA